MTDIREKIKAKIESGVRQSPLRDKLILDECKTWACWKELDEDEQDEVIEGYEKVARLQHELTGTAWAQRCMKLVEALTWITEWGDVHDAHSRKAEVALKAFEKELEK